MKPVPLYVTERRNNFLMYVFSSVSKGSFGTCLWARYLQNALRGLHPKRLIVRSKYVQRMYEP